MTNATEAPARDTALPVLLGKVEPIPLQPQYKLGLAGVTVFMLLLPVLYLLLILAVLYGVWWYGATFNYLVDQPYLYCKVLFFAPLLAGGLLTLFMLKPFFFHSNRHDRHFELRQQDAPEFHQFVGQIAGSLGVPTPRHIWIDFDVNAGAYLRRSMFGLRQESVLIVGLPLLATLDMREMAGVIAHEICHLSQRLAMTLSAIIRRINFWFAYAVYGPHIVEELLDYSSEISPLSLVLFTARFFIWITRGVLWGLMYAGYNASCYLTQQMELDADRYAARVSGSDVYERLAPKLELLGAALGYIDYDLNFAATKEALPDDLIPLLLANREQARHSGLRDSRNDPLAKGQKYLRTHPPYSERVANARHEAATGVISTDTPVRTLFPDFDGFCKTFTREWYRICTNRTQKSVTGTAELLKRLGKEPETLAAYARYMGVDFSVLRPLPVNFDSISAPADVERVKTELLEYARRAVNELPDWRESQARFEKHCDQQLNALTSKTAAEIWPDFPKKADGAESALQPGDWKELAEKLSVFETNAAQRMIAALQLYCVPEIKAQVCAAPAVDFEKLLPALKTLSALLPELNELRRNEHLLLNLFWMLSAQMRRKRVFKLLKPQLAKSWNHIGQVYKKLENTLFPFESVRDDLTLRRYAIPILPEPDDAAEIFSKSEDVIHTLFPLYFSILARFALYADAVEKIILKDRNGSPVASV